MTTKTKRRRSSLPGRLRALTPLARQHKKFKLWKRWCARQVAQEDGKIELLSERLTAMTPEEFEEEYPK